MPCLSTLAASWAQRLNETQRGTRSMLPSDWLGLEDLWCPGAGGVAELSAVRTEIIFIGSFHRPFQGTSPPSPCRVRQL